MLLYVFVQHLLSSNVQIHFVEFVVTFIRLRFYFCFLLFHLLIFDLAVINLRFQKQHFNFILVCLWFRYHVTFLFFPINHHTRNKTAICLILASATKKTTHKSWWHMPQMKCSTCSNSKKEWTNVAFTSHSHNFEYFSFNSIVTYIIIIIATAAAAANQHSRRMCHHHFNQINFRCVRFTLQFVLHFHFKWLFQLNEVVGCCLFM